MGGGGYKYTENMRGGGGGMKTLKIWGRDVRTQEIWGGGDENIENRGGVGGMMGGGGMNT